MTAQDAYTSNLEEKLKDMNGQIADLKREKARLVGWLEKRTTQRNSAEAERDVMRSVSQGSAAALTESAKRNIASQAKLAQVRELVNNIDETTDEGQNAWIVEQLNSILGGKLISHDGECSSLYGRAIGRNEPCDCGVDGEVVS